MKKHFTELVCTVIAAVFSFDSVNAQTIALPKTSRIVYKCEIKGKISYTDEPCVDAQKIDVEPTRGLNSSTGKELTGKDVAREHQREALANAVKPITGLNPQQYENEVRRINLPPAAKQECKYLDHKIPEAEYTERTSSLEAKESSQEHLLFARKRYKELKC